MSQVKNLMVVKETRSINLIEDIIRLNSLYDYYGKLLTDNQRQAFYYYYRMDYSLSEIAQVIGISKQGVSDNLKRATKELEHFEENLGLLEKSTNINAYLEDIKSIVSKEDSEANAEISNLLRKIAEELED